MKKEAVNTFTKGMVMDFHPMLTPNNVLTNNLNGTLITFNGNEYVLQNDLGNGEVGTAKLPAGYVPVGMKEHGGIIYVASHNPITNKSQVGSFPSPQQLYTGEDDNLASVTIKLSNLISAKNSIPTIQYSIYREKLFENTTDNTYKTFYPGDKFIIGVKSIDPIILGAIADGVLKLHLGVITKSGTIEYIDESKLRTYDELSTTDGRKVSTWLCPISDTLTAKSVLSDSTKVQVFNNKSSGNLILVAELVTLNTFDLIRTYSQSSDGTITVSFNGVFKSNIDNYNGKTYPENDYRKLLSDSTNLVSKYDLSGTSETKTYNISPAIPYGVLSKMNKSGIIDFSEIRPNSEKFSEWRFFINTDSGYIRINWGYDYYNMSEEEAISKMEFLFFDLSTTPSNDILNATTDSLDSNITNIKYRYEVTRDYYNGNFEEIIPFSSSTLSANRIYIVLIRKRIDGVWSNVAFRFVYTGTFFNTLYETYSDFTKIGESDRTSIITTTPSIKNTITATKTEYKNHLGTTDVDYSTSISPSSFIQKVAQTDNVDDYYYSTKVKRTYSLKSTISISNNWNSSSTNSYYKYVGDLDTAQIDDCYKNPTVTINDTFDYSNLATSSSDTLADIIKDTSRIESSVSNVTFNGLEGTGVLSTTREIYAKNGGINEFPAKLEKLLPIYSTNMATDYKKTLFNYSVDNDVITCCTGDRSYISYNSRIMPGVAHTEGDYKGQKCAAGSDDVGLQASMFSMGDGIIGLLAGHDKDNASYQFDNAYGSQQSVRLHSGSVEKPWYTSKNEIDGEDDFVLTVWKNETGKYSVINFGSRKTDSVDVSTPSATSFIIRVDKMLNCILSQILTINNVSSNLYFVGPSNSAYTYHTPFNTIVTATLTNANTTSISNAKVTYAESGKTIDELVNTWTSFCSNNLVNFLPIINVVINSINTLPIEFGSDIKMDDSKINILDYYISAYSRESEYSVLPSSITSIDNFRSKLFVVDPSTYTGTNTDGSLLFSTDSFGNYTPLLNNNTIVDDKLALWDYKLTNTAAIEKLHYGLNKMFINSYAVEGKTGELRDTYFNSMYLRTDFSPNSSSSDYLTYYRKGKWTKGSNANAPDLCWDITFWYEYKSTGARVIDGNIYSRKPYSVKGELT